MTQIFNKDDKNGSTKMINYKRIKIRWFDSVGEYEK